MKKILVFITALLSIQVLAARIVEADLSKHLLSMTLECEFTEQEYNKYKKDGEIGEPNYKIEVLHSGERQMRVFVKKNNAKKGEPLKLVKVYVSYFLLDLPEFGCFRTIIVDVGGEPRKFYIERDVLSSFHQKVLNCHMWVRR